MKKINIISPWPGQKNGIADYANIISRYISVHHNIITEAVDYTSSNSNLRILHPNDADAHLSLSKGKNIFHLGNNADHIYEVPLFIRYTGDVVLHDISLYNLTQLTDKMIPGFFEYFLRREQPEIADKLLEIWRTSGEVTSLEYQELNLISWLKPAKNIIVHSNYAAKIVKEYLPSNKIHVIPHFAYQSDMNINTILALQKQFKEKYNIREDEMIISSVGFIKNNKQYGEVIKAFDIIPQSLRKNFRYIVAGEGNPSEYDFSAALRGTHAAEQTIVLDYIKEDELTELLAASDIIINLRYPTFGESSGSIARAFGCGCLTVVSDSGSYREIDDELCYKLPSKQYLSYEIACLLQDIYNKKDKIIEKRIQILHYASTKLHPNFIAREYMKVMHHD